MKRAVLLAVIALASATEVSAQGQALTRYLNATDETERNEAATALIQMSPPVSQVYEALKTGKSYPSDVPTGRIEAERKNRDGTLHRYFFVVPREYDPSQRYSVRVYLHGGVSRARHERGGAWWSRWERLVADDHIAVFPASWNGSLWWRESQVENIRGILAELKNTYNVDENRITLTGVSDGGTGAYFFAFKDTTPWASFFPFIGSPGVLLNPRVGADGRMHVANLINKPLYIVNGETDRLYPVSSVRPFLESFGESGVPFEFHPQPGGHNTEFWPALVDDIDQFHANFPRDPHPDRVIWAAETARTYARAHWLVIDEIGPIPGDQDRAALAALTEEGQAGVVEAIRGGNTVELTAHRVSKLRLLISPEEFDLDQPIRVVINGTEVHNRTIPAHLPTLLKWAGIDQDRTMLFVAELDVESNSGIGSRSGIQSKFGAGSAGPAGSS